jgi:hypothetical protein
VQYISKPFKRYDDNLKETKDGMVVVSDTLVKGLKEERLRTRCLQLQVGFQ